MQAYAAIRRIGVDSVIVRFLGTHNAESRSTRLVSFLIDDILAVDAGCLTSELSFSEQEKIKAILLSHGHYDHIRGIPAFAFNNSHQATRVFGTQQTLEILCSHLIDGLIYPKFTDRTCFLGKPALELRILEPFKPEDVEGYRILAIPVNHSIDTVGLEITSGDGKSIFYTGDTGPGLLSLWEHVSPHLLIADVTFPNRFGSVAKDAKHLCPEMLKLELKEFRRVKGYLPQVVLIHVSPQFEEEIRVEAQEVATELGLSIGVACEGEKLII
jgi:ribonuclease BN (tRNA processing enzyme)